MSGRRLTRRQVVAGGIVGMASLIAPRGAAEAGATATAAAAGTLTVGGDLVVNRMGFGAMRDRKSTRLNSSHDQISYAVFCLKKKKERISRMTARLNSHT